MRTNYSWWRGSGAISITKRLAQLLQPDYRRNNASVVLMSGVFYRENRVFERVVHYRTGLRISSGGYCYVIG